jgi:hypothetical protein
LGGLHFEVSPDKLTKLHLNKQGECGGAH